MGRVYSTRFVAAHGISGSVSWTCPAGYVAVVRDVDWFIATAVEVGGVAYAYGPAGQTWDYHGLGANSAGSFHWSGRLVLTAGETITFVSDGSNETVDVTVSGYLLSAAG